MRKEGGPINRLRTKLNGRSGASLLIALVFFLLCLTVGAVILTAATASSGRLVRFKQEQQDYLSVSSAARLLRDGLEGAKFVLVETESDTVPKYENAPVITPEELFLSAILSKDALDVFHGAPSRRTLTLTADDGQTVPVKVDWAMENTADNAPYRITVSLATEAGGNRMTLVVPAQVDVDFSREESEEPSINEAGEQIILFHWKETTTTTITWGKGIIRKGVASAT